jgi:two-component system, OmpR family, KDP operon response regulator KdpE
MKKTLVLVVDDEVSIVKFLRANLEANGFDVVTALNGEEGLRTFEKELPDLVILDIMMPVMDGFEVCRRIREWSQVPIIMLSARGDERDKVKCLNLGADDYVTKPFGAGELTARVRAVMRRVEPSLPPVQSLFTTGNLIINFSQRRVTCSDKDIKLTPTEYNLLQELVMNKGKVLTHLHLLNKVWGQEYRDDTQYLHVFIGRLRTKLEPDPLNPIFILTVPRVGYQFTENN